MQIVYGVMVGVKDVAQCIGVKWRSLAATSIVLVLFVLFYFRVSALRVPGSSRRSGKSPSPVRTNVSMSTDGGVGVPIYVTQPNTSGGHTSEPVSRPITFDPHGNDTLVFLHIQKTGGTQFSTHLVTLKKHGVRLCVNPESDKHQRAAPTKKDYSYCPRSWRLHNSADPWLVSGKTVGWVCGVHAFYTEFKYCLEAGSSRAAARGVDTRRNFHYITLLRHPVLRYISEYLHVQRGAKWSNRHECGGKEVTDAEMPPCYPGYYDGEAWTNVSLVDFYSCTSNWANNRQTMMVADLESVGCFTQTAHPPETIQKTILESAKRNLAHRFPFFALTEYMNESVLLFERTFGMQFGQKLVQRSLSDIHSAPLLHSLWDSRDLFDKIARANSLDMQLYEYALQLFSARAKAVGIEIDFDKIEKTIQTLDMDSVAHTAKKFSRFINYNLIQ